MHPLAGGISERMRRWHAGSGDVSRGRDEFGDVWQHTNDTR
jgi:hypothetical protein